MNFSEAMFCENYLTSDFHTNTVISRRVCLLIKMASKTMIRSVMQGSYHGKQGAVLHMSLFIYLVIYYFVFSMDGTKAFLSNI